MTNNTKLVKRSKMNTKTIMVTGANSGIGYKTALGLAKAGHHVVMVCRNKERGESAQKRIIEATGNQTIDLILIDLSSLQSVRDGVSLFLAEHSQLDVLINNAANFDITQKTVVKTVDNLEAVFATNHFAPFLITNLLLPALKTSPSGHIINIASKGLIAHPFIDIDFDNLNSEKKFSASKAYYHSKLAQIIFTFDLAERLKKDSIRVNCIRVPAVKLDDGRYDHIPALLRSIYRFKMSFSLSTDEMAETYIKLATSDKFKDVTGAYIDEECKQVKAPKKAYNRETWQKLWDVSAEITGIMR